MPLWIRIVLALYGVLCIAALALAVIGSEGLFGVEPDALAGVFAIMLAMPWPLLLSGLGMSATTFLVFLAGGMLLNAGLIAGIGKLLRYWSTPRKQAV